ncbi:MULTISPECIES: hypothetical protein [Acinetobacter]|uniref:hypothetical protein n=1 Tax=Acinetobacter TaxID=469 RepID=UPI00039D1D5A|nr:MULTISPECIES: hypothetical protein [Acinetobacter]MCH7353665.1 hypothetical protein [Acinetobacter sp. NIPH 2023]MCH7357200.1 hypothetical protein [Acinetobacter sp. NIPH 1958]MCH7361017.1 hypothetical protein [Acinetobacter sp. NIPH 2024]MEB6668334.1 hypothetical protein [Acinetobacter vivianii]
MRHLKELPENWVLIQAEKESIFSNELKRELILGHVLFAKKAVAIARKDGEDDVLFFLENQEDQYAEVHLTWNNETNPRWPHTSLFKSFNDWKKTIEDAWE